MVRLWQTCIHCSHSSGSCSSVLSLPEEEVCCHNICLLPPGVPVPLGHLHQHNVEQDGWGLPLTPRAMSLFSFLIPPLRFQMTSIGLGDGLQEHFQYSFVLPWSEMGHSHPQVGGGPLLAHGAVEEAEEPGELLDHQLILALSPTCWRPWCCPRRG